MGGRGLSVGGVYLFSGTRLSPGVLDQPLEGDVDVVFLLAGDRVAANLSVLDGRQVHPLYELLLIQSSSQVPLITQNQNRNSLQLRFVQQVVEFVLGGFDFLWICRVDHVNNSADSSAVTLPHAPEARLTADIPQLDNDVALGDLPHVESNCGNHVFTELPRRYHIDEGRFAGVLQPHQGQLHLLLPEQRLEPVQQFVDQRYHLRRLTLKLTLLPLLRLGGCAS